MRYCYIEIRGIPFLFPTGGDEGPYDWSRTSSLLHNKQEHKTLVLIGSLGSSKVDLDERSFPCFEFPLRQASSLFFGNVSNRRWCCIQRHLRLMKVLIRCLARGIPKFIPRKRTKDTTIKGQWNQFPFQSRCFEKFSLQFGFSPSHRENDHPPEWMQESFHGGYQFWDFLKVV